MSDDVLTRLNEVVRDVFNDSSIAVTNEMIISDINGWDSFNHITLMAAIQDEFDISFTTDDIAKIKTFGEVISIIEKK